jgi:hypothetical protein
MGEYRYTKDERVMILELKLHIKWTQKVDNDIWQTPNKDYQLLSALYTLLEYWMIEEDYEEFCEKQRKKLKG